MKKATITVGIPAYNEEQNIQNLLRSIVGQKETQFVIKEVIVVSDKSTDQTNELVKKIKDGRIKLIKNKKRLGQSYSQNLIFSKAITDVVVLFEADTCPADNHYLHYLLTPLFNDSSIGLVQGNFRSAKPRTFVGNILFTQGNIYRKFSSIDKSVTEAVCSGGGGRAFARALYTKLVWPPAVPEDLYANMWCKQNGIKTFFEKNAICLYQTTQSYTDYVKKRQKIKSAYAVIKYHFPALLADTISPVKLSRRIKMLMYFIVKSPILFFCYCILQVRYTFESANDNFTDYWPIATSTKKLKEL